MNGPDVPAMSPGLRGRTLTAALSARPAGRATPAPERIAPLEAYRRSADALDGLLGSLGEADWRRATVRGLDVQGLVGHLIGVEDHLARALGHDPSVADADHVASTRDVAAAQAGRAPTRTHRDWSAAVARCVDAVPSADLETRAALHGMRLTAGSLLVARAFELWTHAEDIARATGRPARAPDASTLTLMTALAVSALPAAVQRVGTVGQVSLRLVLTGPGGGTWRMEFEAAGGEPPAADETVPAPLGIVTSAADFCRVVADRVAPAALEHIVTGDRETAAAVLTAATTLALD